MMQGAASTVICVLANQKSGGRTGDRLLSMMGSLPSVYGEARFALPIHEAAKDPERLAKILNTGSGGREKERRVDKCVVVFAGGDGTCKWGLEIVDGLRLDRDPLIVTLPLGTSNELAAHLRWGSSFNVTRKNIDHMVHIILHGHAVPFDTWVLQYKPEEETETNQPWTNDMLSFASIGIDAKIAYKFHLRRQQFKWTTKAKNKLTYVWYGLKRILSWRRPISELVSVSIEAEEQAAIPREAQSIVMMNIPNIADKVDYWKPKRKSRRAELQHSTDPAIDDGLLEVSALYSIPHYLSMKMLFSHAFRLAQSRQLTFTILQPAVLQIDGEGYLLAPGTLQVRFKRQIRVILGGKK